MAEPRTQRQLRYARPPGACELLLVRHGESIPAVDGVPFDLASGQGDPPLAPEGEAQAEAVADRLVDQGIEALYVTTLQRTAQTAAPLAARLGLTPAVEADLREVHLGEWEGGAYRFRVMEGHPATLAMAAEERWSAIPGAEDDDAFRARLRAGVERIAAAHPDQRVAAFSHAGAIAMILSMATGARPFAFVGLDNGSISHLVVTPGAGWAVRRVNDTGHLGYGFDHLPQALT